MFWWGIALIGLSIAISAFGLLVFRREDQKVFASQPCHVRVIDNPQGGPGGE